MTSQAHLGQKAFDARDYTSAIKHYTEALNSSRSPLWLTQRSIAYQRIGSHQLALHDAEDAVLQAISRGRRELIAAAQMRRAIALYSLGRFGDARLCFTWVRRLNEKEKGLGMWQAKVVAEYEKLDEGADTLKVTVKETPDKVERLPPADVQSNSTTGDQSFTKQARAPTVIAEVASGQTPKEKIRHEWYQSSRKVTINIFAKNVPKDQADIKISAQSLDVSFPTGSGSNYDYTLLKLYDPIEVGLSTYAIMPSKVEIILHKAIALKWPSLEGARPETSSIANESNLSPASHVTLQASAGPSLTKAPAYPTSSRTGAKNWDLVAKDALMKEKEAAKMVSADTSDPQPPPQDDDDFDDEGDPLQGFFKKLYKDANPDTRRAMMKSYVESNGTALSTDWDDVGKKTIPINPPDGIEAKKWAA